MLVWHLERSESNYGHAKRALTGHAHYVQDVVISSDGQFALSGSWDGTLRLWDLTTGATTRRFVGHTKDVLSVAFSVDNRQVGVGCARDALMAAAAPCARALSLSLSLALPLQPTTTHPTHNTTTPTPHPPPRSCRGRATRRSSCGTRSASASTRSASPRATPSGCRACASRR